MSEMNLHLFTDSNLVTQIINKFEKYGDDNKYIVFGTKLKYTFDERVVHYKSYDDLKKSDLDFHLVERVFIHYLSGYAINFILDNPQIDKYLWFFWGADGYWLPDLEKRVLMAKTKKNARKRLGIFKKLKQEILAFYKLHKLKKAFKLINYCCTWVSGDYALVKHYSKKMKFYEFAYLSEQDLFNDSLIPSDFNTEKLTVLAGNSLNPTNNHFELTDFIAKVFGKETSVYFPISYSGKAVYKKKIKNYIEGHLINPHYLENFMPLNEYLSFLSKCDVVIFFHLRQQAANNSLSLLWMGKILIMHPESTLYEYLKMKGLSVLSYREVHTIEDIFTFDNKNQNRVNENRRILKQVFSESEIEQMYTGLYEL